MTIPDKPSRHLQRYPDEDHTPSSLRGPRRSIFNRRPSHSARAAAIQCSLFAEAKRDCRSHLGSFAMTRVQDPCVFRVPKGRLSMNP